MSFVHTDCAWFGSCGALERARGETPNVWAARNGPDPLDAFHIPYAWCPTARVTFPVGMQASPERIGDPCISRCSVPDQYPRYNYFAAVPSTLPVVDLFFP